MATKKVVEPELELEEEEEEYQMNPAFSESLTVAVPVETKEDTAPRVTIMLPKLIDDDNGIKVDQYEHVTIANEQGEMCYKVLRGEYVDVPISVFIALKAKYPKI